ncbi:hypothetical protein GGX14DRAFT_635267 [Mycena pura]|uniref:Uncharacterized protein n=1 Tax=Mycena pura TaxID=153505 RepID=A0AAD6VAJ9_9AGAR|nr:hypothetical protein GGX14DRAFT_635267 [Mycena pura]
MSSQTSRRARVASPNRATFKKLSPKPILKRPSPLNLPASPYPFAASITIVVSPATVSSPHVQFAASPALAAVFSTHSPNSYDRSATAVSPNPLEIPGWGQRMYSPGEATFSSVKSPPAMVPVLFVDAPSLAAPLDAHIKSSAAARGKSRPSELSKALAAYPRSPYPSAPTSPLSRNKENAAIAAGVGRAKSLDSPKAKPTRRVVRLPASLRVPVARPVAARVSSPLANDGATFLSPVAESPRTVTLSSTRLSQEFWQSVSLEDAEGECLRPSAFEHEEGSTPVSAVPRFIFSTKDGLLWSPGLPPKVPTLVADVRSPVDKTACEFDKPDRAVLNSPGDLPPPYPTIATVLFAVDPDTIAYPPPVLNRESLM